MTQISPKANLAILKQKAWQRRQALTHAGLSTYTWGHQFGRRAIVCLCCGQSSTNDRDISSKYCQICQTFQAEEQMAVLPEGAIGSSLTMQQLGAIQARNEQRKRFAYTDTTRQIAQDIDEAIAEIIRLRALLEQLKGRTFPPGMIELPRVGGDR